MLAARIYSTEWEVDRRLDDLFAVSRNDLIEVVRLALAQRLNCVAADALSAPGQKSYLHGTKHLRLLFLRNGWEIDRRENIESSFDPKSGRRVVFQNVDAACLPFKHPKAISGKGPAADRQVENAQGQLFPPGMAPEAIPPHKIASLNSSLWYFCVSFDDENVCAELSLPAHVKSNNFHGFIERIFIVSGGGWAGIADTDDNDKPVDLLPTITRRK